MKRFVKFLIAITIVLLNGYSEITFGSCYSLSYDWNSTKYTSDGGTGTITAKYIGSLYDACSGTVSVSDNWITIDRTVTYSGSTTIYYSVSKNTASSPRVGLIYMGDSLIGISQSGATTPPPTDYNLSLYASISITPNPILKGKAVDVKTNIINKGSGAFTGSYGAALHNSDGSFLSWIEIKNNKSLSGGGYYYTNGLTFHSDSISYEPGLYRITIQYKPTGGSWKIISGGSYSSQISITIRDTDVPGNINGDTNGNVDLTDAILALRILAGISITETINLNADVNGDGKIGMEEEIYILQTLSGLR